VPSTYYIDGYNVVFHCPDLHALARRDTEVARDTFVDMVSRFCAVSGKRVTIVFDGRGRVPEPVRPSCGSPYLDIVYSPGHQCADTIIERLVYNAKGDRSDIVVVSGDYGIRDLCLALGALTITPAVFLGMVRDALARARADLQGRTNRRVNLRFEDRLDDASLDHLRNIRHTLDGDEPDDRGP